MDGRLAEAYTNLEHYECQLREMDKLRQNLTIYDNLLEGESSKLSRSTRHAVDSDNFSSMTSEYNEG